MIGFPEKEVGKNGTRTWFETIMAETFSGTEKNHEFPGGRSITRYV